MTESLLYDARGAAHTPLPAGPVRLVSLVPSTTETLFALGRGADMVGYTRFCVHPREQVRAERWIGGTKNPKIERIVALRPDLVLANREENRLEDVNVLESAGVRVWVAEPRSVAAAIEEIETVGSLVGRAEEGAALARELRGLAGAAPGGGPTAAYLIWSDPFMAAGAETFIADMLAQGGLRVPFPGRYPEVTLEALKQVDLILLASEPFPFSERHRVELANLGINEAKIHLVEGELISWHGARMREGLPYVRALCVKALHADKEHNL